MIEKFPKVWQEKWEDLGFNAPTPIQTQAFDLLQAKENVLGISPTGSGKTLAYLLPLLLNVEKDAGNQLLILLSSQELAMQVFEVAKVWAKDLELQVTSIIGGANTKNQEAKLKKRPEVIIGTPGRVFELIRSKKIKIMNLKTICLDEVDQLFADQNIGIAEKIINYAPVDFQLVFFSATGDVVREKIQAITKDNLTIVDVSQIDQSAGNIQHIYLSTSARERVDVLRSLAHMKDFQAIVFFNQLSDLGAAEEKLLYLGLSVGSLASDQGKMIRKAVLDKFKNGEIKLLLATDLLARGLDIPDLPYVVNFEIPFSKESYTHRSGRTGRMGKDGIVLTLVDAMSLKDYKKLATAKEVFLWGGKLLDERPVVEKAAVKEEAAPKKVKEQSKNTKAAKKPKNKKKKSQKDKGKPKKKS